MAPTGDIPPCGACGWYGSRHAPDCYKQFETHNGCHDTKTCADRWTKAREQVDTLRVIAGVAGAIERMEAFKAVLALLDAAAQTEGK